MMVVGVAWILWILVSIGSTGEARPRRIVVDTDANTDDIFALFYLLKQNRAEADLQGITINTNGWSDAGHAVNYIYDILFMMDRDDIPVAVGGEGGIFPNGTILPNVGGYQPLIDQGTSTAGECRYSQAIPLGQGGRQDVNSNYGLRKGYLPQDAYTKEVTGSEAVRVLVATKAKRSKDTGSSTVEEFCEHYLDVINHPEQTGRFSIRTQFPYYKEVLYKPEFCEKLTGKPVAFDMDMSAGDFLALLYLLKLPVELINLKGILITSSGWATSATVDVVYDILHMMGCDDIPVGLGDAFSIGEAYPYLDLPTIGDCKYRKAIPQGSGGFLDSDTLYGLARDLPRSPRRYTAENSVKFGAPLETNPPELRQPLALDVWKSIVESLDPGSKITILTNGPLTNLAQIISLENTSSVIQDVYVVGGHIAHDNEKGNLFTISSNEYAEFNIFLDPLAAKAVFESNLDITLIPLSMQRRVSSFHEILNKMHFTDPPEIEFARRLLSRLWRLQQTNHRYHHMDMFLGEILGAVILAGNPNLDQTFKYKPLKILADGDLSKIGQIVIDERQGKLVRILESVNPSAYYDSFGRLLRDQRQSAVIGSFYEQARIWSTPPNTTHSGHHAEF